MVTNPIQRIVTTHGELFIKMKDREVNLNSVIAAANNARAAQGFTCIDLRDYVRSDNFVRMVLATEQKLGFRLLGDVSGVRTEYAADGTVRRHNLVSSPIVRTERGKFGGTWCHPFVGIDAAAHLDKSLAVDLYEILTTSPIFQLREEGGDLYKELVEAVIILAGAESRIPAKLQLLARVIAARCGIAIRTDNTTWNYATAEQLHIRRDLQFAITVAIRNNMIVSFQHLVEYVGNGYFPVAGLQQINLNEVIKEKVSVLNFLENQPVVFPQLVQFAA